MTSLLGWLLSNICMATLLAVAAAAVGRLARRPALAHALWLLVLIKLITPPLIPFPIGPQEPFAAPSPSPAPSEEKTKNVAQLPRPAVPEKKFSPPLPPQPEVVVLDEAEESKAGETTEPMVAEESSAPSPQATQEPAGSFIPDTFTPLAPASPAGLGKTTAPINQAAAGTPWPWLSALGWAWLIGSLWWLGVAGRRVWQFQRQLRFAQPVSAEIQEISTRLAQRMGVRCPDIWLFPGQVAPMLWALGRSRCLLLPAALLERVTAQQCAALIAHELAHLRRGDHYVRWLELAVLALYWWCPLAWWARRELREAEEDCCDAWVVWALPGVGKAYALALVETIDFLTEAPAPEPLLASGLGQVQHLRRRLTMIMRGTTPRGLTLAGGLVVLGAAVLLLPLLPTWGQPPREGEKKEFRDKERKEFRDKERKEFRDKERKEFPDKGPFPPDARRIQEELERIKMELDKHREMAERRAHQLRDALENMHRAEKGDKEPGRRPPFGGPGFPGPGPGGPGGPEGRLHEIERKLDAVLNELHQLRKELQQRPRFGGPGGFGPPGGFQPRREGDKGPERKGPPGFERKGPRREGDKGPERKGPPDVERKGPRREGDKGPERKGPPRDGDKGPERKGPPRPEGVDIE